MLPQNDIHPENNQYLVESNLLHPEKWQGLCLFGVGYMVLWEYDHYYQRERERGIFETSLPWSKHVIDFLAIPYPPVN
jgi:hypothetical protein